MSIILNTDNRPKTFGTTNERRVTQDLVCCYSVFRSGSTRDDKEDEEDAASAAPHRRF